MNRSSLSSVQPTSAITQQSPAAIVRPATSEQALEMLQLMMTDVIAQAEATMAWCAERMPLDDQDAPQAKALEPAAKDNLSCMTQSYVRKHGNLTVPLISLGSDYDTMRAALRPVFDKISENHQEG
ncbi:hypothetical protein [Acidithiobacillus ferrooxidans]|jgi:hypothetical protein|uniref:hypothetical protein n=1 Tax=Acidithiobacillus ferrooxidans TaxID=920 RepID=UPI000B12D460|nr:hypothetical protein [Acidithiobacillus ferrooxidans]